MTNVSCRMILDRTALLGGLSDGWRGKLAQLAHIAQYTSGQVIFREGESVPGLYCVGDGLVRVVKESPTGKQLVLHFAQAGHTFGEVAVFGNFCAPATAEAVDDSLCAVIPAASLQALLEAHHDLCRELLAATAHWVRSLVGLLEDIVLRDATARVARYLVEAEPNTSHQHFTLPVLKKDLAAYLNLTQETLSRTLRKLVEAELIESAADGSVRIVDAAGMAQVASLGMAAV